MLCSPTNNMTLCSLLFYNALAVSACLSNSGSSMSSYGSLLSTLKSNRRKISSLIKDSISVSNPNLVYNTTMPWRSLSSDPHFSFTPGWHSYTHHVSLQVRATGIHLLKCQEYPAEPRYVCLQYACPDGTDPVLSLVCIATTRIDRFWIGLGNVVS